MNNLFLMFNTKHKPFDDVRVRQALHYAIDTGKMVEVALKGRGKPASSFLDESNPSYRRAKTVYAYDPDKAKALLKAAGVRGLSIEILAVNVSWIVDCLPTIKSSWDAIGVRTTLSPQETTAVFTKMDQKQDYQVVAAASNPNQFGLDADLIMHYNYGPENLWMQYTRWWRLRRQGALQGHGPGHPGAGRREEEDDGPGLHRRRRRTGRALPGRPQRADDGLEPEAAQRDKATAVPWYQPPPGQVGLTDRRAFAT